MIHPAVAARFPLLDGLTSMREAYSTPAGLQRIRAYESWGPEEPPPVVEIRDDVAPGPHGRVPVRIYVPPPLRPLRVPMADLAEVLPHTHFIQAKFFEIDDDLRDLHVPWGDIVPTLEKAGWNGWLSSEYEGRREPYRGRDQVRRQHALIRSLQNGSR